jgi:four helix bundle protein
MASFKRFEDIIAWQKARLLNQILARHIAAGKFKNDFKLINQMQDSCGSIMDTIPEGFERGGNREFIQFLYYSKGSCGEFRSQLYRSLDREYLTSSAFEEMFNLAREIILMLQKLITYLENSPMKGPKFKNRVP